MNCRSKFFTLAMIIAAVVSGTDSACAGVRGKSYNISGQSIIDGSPIVDVYHFHFDNSFSAQSNPTPGQWNELDLLLFSIFIASIQQSTEPVPTSANIIGLSAGSQITGLGLAQFGPLIIISGGFSGAQIP